MLTVGRRFIFLFVFIALLFISSARTVSVHAQEFNSKKGIDLINQYRADKQLKKLEIDDNLCKVAQMVANDLEIAYPQKVDRSLSTNPKYKKFMESYSKYVLADTAQNDVIIEFYKNVGTKPLPPSEEILSKSSVQLAGGSTVGTALEASLTTGCMAVSNGNLGYKPFGVFLGGVKKTGTANNIIDIIKSFFNSFSNPRT